MICLDDKSDNKEKNVISLLNIALDNDVSTKEKLEFLKENFHIRTTEKLGKAVSNMCNYSEGVLQKGIEQGIEKGRAEERKNSIITLISALIELGSEEDTVINKVSEKFEISTKLAKEFYTEYKKTHS